MRLFGPPLEPEEAAERMGWFVRLRWLAVAGILAIPVAGRLLLRFRFSMVPFALIAGGAALYNVIFLFLGRSRRFEGRSGGGLAGAQVGLDLLVLTLLMHFGGGIENPFILYYLFHAVIAAVLLPRWQMFLQVLFASACITGLAIAELAGLLHHYHVGGLLPVELYANWKFVTVALFAIITTLWVSAFLAASITKRLHTRETELARANAVLAEQDRTKSQYVMRVAHDLAEPAGLITSCLKLLTQGLAGPVPSKALDIVRRAQQKSEYLGHLIKDLLSLSRIKAAREIPKAEVELVKIIDGVFDEIQLWAAEKDVALKQELADDLPAVYCNAGAIHELLGNLVTNAVKYTPVGGRVEVTASNAGPEVLVKVQDDGVGIPSEAMPHIFQEFYRADNVRAEGVEGTGLGLSIVAQILNVHGGRIWVQSKEGEGSTFAFTLPVAGQPHEQA